MRRAVLLAALALAIPPSALAANRPPAVQRDLELAVVFWHVEEPQLSAPCSPEVVNVAPLGPGLANNGLEIPAASIGAETSLGSCVITFAPWWWKIADAISVCLAIAHEYGHTLGLPDTASVNMMDATQHHWDDPLCVQAVFGWRWVNHHDRQWLAEHHLKGVRTSLARPH